MQKLKTWKIWGALLLIANFIAGVLMLSLFTNGTLIDLPASGLFGIFAGIALVLLLAPLILTAKPRSIAGGFAIGLWFTLASPFAAMLSSSLYIASEIQGAFATAVLHSLIIMAPILLIAGARVILITVVLNASILFASRRSFTKN